MAQHPLIDKPESVPMSLPPSVVTALERLAALDGHTNRSAIVRKLVDREARQILGDDWQIVVRANLQAQVA